jgi:pimeloyl-ACP methyl ester carboxylesterase
MPTSAIPNNDIVLRREGDGGSALVFVHGFLDDQHVWNPVLAELSAPGFETVRFDQAGFGGRSEPSGPITLDVFTADLSAVIDAVDKPFVLVGHSMAAPIVELVAGAHPERALGLVLLAPIPLAGTHYPDELMDNFGSVDTFLEARRHVAPSTPEGEFDRVTKAGANIRSEFLRAAADVWNNGDPAGEQPSGFTGPVLILAGGDDPLITTEVLASAVTPRFDSGKTTLVEIGQSSHWPHVERSQAVAEAISRFLARDLATEVSEARR